MGNANIASCLSRRCSGVVNSPEGGPGGGGEELRRRQGGLDAEGGGWLAAGADGDGQPGQAGASRGGV